MEYVCHSYYSFLYLSMTITLISFDQICTVHRFCGSGITCDDCSPYCLPFASIWDHLGSVLLNILVLCVVLLFVFTFLIPCCDVRCDLCIKMMFGSSLPPVVCRRDHVLFAFLCSFALSGFRHILWCFCFVFLRLVCPSLPVSLDCQFLIAPSVFSNIYLHCWCSMSFNLLSII